MDTTQVSLLQSNGLLRAAMNQKLEDNLSPVLDGTEVFSADAVTKLDNILQLNLVEVDKAVMGPATIRYLGAPALLDSFWFPRMGTNVFLNMRIYRDIIYVKQSRKQRILSGFRGTLLKSLKNKKDRWAYI